jgi:molybdate transport system ATP-binding protein
MKIILLAAGVAAIAFSAGAVAAAPTVAGPKQPIPYSELSAYMKASPKVRAHKDWWSGQTAQASASAETGSAANTSATAPSLPADTAAAPSGATSANPPSTGGDTKEAAPQLPSPAVTPPTPGAVNPSAAVTPGAPASTAPPK